ncbi:MAG: glycosyltransferase family 4 protein [Ferruginibacter sp.]|nr:glycosyltransferase family 4 protein [Ferruginibacter sp.]
MKYGIDYIDPWVHVFPGSNKIFSRHWLSTKLAKFLEPRAVKKASLITGVAEGYYQGVIDRNPHLKPTCVFGAMPYGGEAEDHLKVKELNLKPYLFKKNNKIQLVYAGAMLPKAYKPLEAIFQSIDSNRSSFENIEFHFIGTGKLANDSQSYNIRQLDEKYGIWNKIVFEYPKRIPYLDVLVHLNSADGVFILGSTEPHYTPSKSYQAVLSGKFILAVLHEQSTAVDVINGSGSGMVLGFDGESGVVKLTENFSSFFYNYSERLKAFDTKNVNYSFFDRFSARSVTEDLVKLLNLVCAN